MYRSLLLLRRRCKGESTGKPSCLESQSHMELANLMIPFSRQEIEKPLKSNQSFLPSSVVIFVEVMLAKGNSGTGLG
jgi:hypothetical protein